MLDKIVVSQFFYILKNIFGHYGEFVCTAVDQSVYFFISFLNLCPELFVNYVHYDFRLPQVLQ